MKLGIFAKTFSRPHFEEALAACKAYGFETIQFNFSCAGLATVPEEIQPALLLRIRDTLSRLELPIAAVSGTCNLIHPDLGQRRKDLAALQRLLPACKSLGSSVVTLCTGTRNPNDMWRAHPSNSSRAAWRDLLKSLEQLLPIAEECKMSLGIEPEPSNVINSAQKARMLLDQVDSKCLKVVFDAANLLSRETISRQREILSPALDLLGPDIVIAHAKDLQIDPDGVKIVEGALDYSIYLSLLQKSGFDGPLIIHGLAETQIPAAVTFLKENLKQNRANIYPRKY